MKIELRYAIREDCPRLLELILELAAYQNARDKISITLDNFTDAGFGNDPIWKAFVAEDESGILGFALYYVRYSTWKGLALHLEDFVITEEHRGKGLGKLLFERLIQEAKNYNGMYWQIMSWNEPAINFYKKYDAKIESEFLNGSLSKEQLMKL